MSDARRARILWELAQKIDAARAVRSEIDRLEQHLLAEYRRVETGGPSYASLDEADRMIASARALIEKARRT